MYAGRITVGIRAKEEGKKVIRAFSENLVPASITIEVMKKPTAESLVSCPVAGDRIEAGHV